MSLFLGLLFLFFFFKQKTAYEIRISDWSSDVCSADLTAMVFFNLAVVVRTVGTAWEGLDPRSGEAAAALGATPWQVFRTATLPALRGSIISAASVVFLFCATAFGVVLILGGLRYATIETEVYLLTTTLFDLPAAAALCLLQLVVVTALLYAAHRARSDSGASVERRAVAPAAIRRSEIPALGVMGIGRASWRARGGQ